MRSRKADERRWRCSLCGKSGRAANPMAEFYFHWRSYHDTTPLQGT